MRRYIEIDTALLKTVSEGGLSAKALWRRIMQQPTIKTKQIKYFDEEESVWKIGEVIVDE